MAIAIKAENISKQYRLGLVGTGTVRDDLKRWYYNVRGKEDPFLKIGDTNDRSQKGSSDYVWSLRDINFEINQGDSVGIIGRNGAGKSTLLKILSQVTQPTTGQIFTKGRIASLLEVGTGFHPEMTGRENIYLNGAILGMRKHEITRKFDEIVDFSGVERYIDTPVKRYSSGMYVRLAFAVAAHLESEILIVDEVLAVGDAEFQKKCLGKMSDVSKGEGRTVLFVSHNMSAVNQLCNKGIYLKNGLVRKQDDVNHIIDFYLNDVSASDLCITEYENKELNTAKPIELLATDLVEEDGQITINISYIVRKKLGCVISIKITNTKEVSLITLRDVDLDSELFSKNPGKYKTSFKFPIHMLAPDKFKVTFSFSDMKSERFEYYPELLTFETLDSNSDVDLTSPREGIYIPKKDFIGTTLIY